MIKGNVKIDRKNLISILQSCLVLILVILVALMMVEIGNLKGTARVINYAGLVRGDTQRAVKLEITGTRNDELIAYLDDILSDLTSGDGHYELVKLKDAAYQERLDIQSAYWERLKAEVAAASGLIRRISSASFRPSLVMRSILSVLGSTARARTRSARSASSATTARCNSFGWMTSV